MDAVRRYGISAAVAAFITFSIFLLMYGLVATGKSVIGEDATGRIIKMIRVERDENLQRKDIVQRPPEQVPPPKIETPRISVSGPSQNAYSFDLNLGREGLGGIGIGKADGEYVPLVRVQPIYPQRAAMDGIEGYVVIEVTVLPDGSVKDPVVVEAEPKGYFERAAMSAALKLKYKPRIINGQGVEVPGVRWRFNFELTDEKR